MLISSLDSYEFVKHKSFLATSSVIKTPTALKEQIFSRRMSQEFLSRLLSASEDREQSGNCMICLEDYNTLNISTGTVEWGICLPCGHRVGSACIVTWLRDNNTCPACRASFFSAQPRPYLEHGIMGDDEPRVAPSSSSTEDVSILVSYVRDFCFVFDDDEAFYAVGAVARSLAHRLMNLVRNPSHRSIAAASIYMASHILRYPKSPREISQISEVSADQIRSVYEQVYPNRMHLIEPRILDEISGDDVEGMLAFLPRPERGTEIIDHGRQPREVRRRNLPLPSHLQTSAARICARQHLELGGVRLYTLSTSIVREIVLETYPDIRSPNLFAAIGLYMASHLLGLGISARRIAEQVCTDEGTLRTAYARVYPLRNQIIDPSMLVAIGLENLPRALEALPALNWPAV